MSEIKVKVSDPASFGWLRRPDLDPKPLSSDSAFEADRPRAWEKPDGTVFLFPVRLDQWGARLPDVIYNVDSLLPPA